MPHTAMQKAWLASKEKAASGTQDVVSGDSRDESLNTPANHAGDQMTVCFTRLLSNFFDAQIQNVFGYRDFLFVAEHLTHITCRKPPVHRQSS